MLNVTLFFNTACGILVLSLDELLRYLVSHFIEDLCEFCDVLFVLFLFCVEFVAEFFHPLVLFGSIDFELVHDLLRWDAFLLISLDLCFDVDLFEFDLVCVCFVAE